MDANGLRIKIKDIRPEGSEVSGELSSAELELTKEDYIYFKAPVKVTARLQIVDDTILANVAVRGRYNSYCARSLEKVERDWGINFMLDFPVTKNTDYVELAEDIRQEIIINLPMRVLSDKELQAEAENSGKDNTTESANDTSISDERVHKPFARLKDIE